MTPATAAPIIILGGGGHARVLADTLTLQGHRVLGFTAPQAQAPLSAAIHWLGDDTAVRQHDPADVALVNGLGSTGRTSGRQALFDQLTGQGYRFAHVRHPAATVSELDVSLGQGVQLLAGSLIGPGVQLRDNVLINSRAVIEHDCRIGAHTHVATGAIVCGGCVIDPGVHVGAGAVLIQGITVGAGAIIAAGAVVTKNVEPLTLVAGVPGTAKRTL